METINDYLRVSQFSLGVWPLVNQPYFGDWSQCAINKKDMKLRESGYGSVKNQREE